MNQRQEALLERAVALLEQLAEASGRPIQRRRPLDVPDMVTADNRTTARLEQERRADERQNGLVPDSPESWRRQYERLDEQFQRLRRDVKRYENAVDQDFGQGASRRMPWNWQEEGKQP